MRKQSVYMAVEQTESGEHTPLLVYTTKEELVLVLNKRFGAPERDVSGEHWNVSFGGRIIIVEQDIECYFKLDT